MNADGTDGATVKIPPPLVYVGGVVVGGVLQTFVLPLSVAVPLGVRWGLCAIAALIGVWLMAAAFGPFRRTGQDPKPWKSTPEIISTGIYRYTRNPMYLSMALLQAAIGLGSDNAWILALVPFALVIVHFIAVRHEEAYLEKKFGDAYNAYRASVRRWL